MTEDEKGREVRTGQMMGGEKTAMGQKDKRRGKRGREGGTETKDGREREGGIEGGREGEGVEQRQVIGGEERECYLSIL